MLRIIMNNVGSRTVRCSKAVLNVSDLSKRFLIGAPDQGVGCEIRISLGVHLTQSARTPNQLECYGLVTSRPTGADLKLRLNPFLTWEV
jgi:hypothetical protein